MKVFYMKVIMAQVDKYLGEGTEIVQQRVFILLQHMGVKALAAYY